MRVDDRPVVTSEAPRYRMFDGVLATVEDVFNLIAASSILILMLMAVAQIFLRTLFNSPIPGFIDITEQAMAVFTFMGIAYCQRVGGHIRMEIVLGALRGRTLWIAEFLGVLVVLIVILALVFGSWFHFMRAWQLGDSTIDIGLATWPSKLLVPVAMTLLCLRLLVQLYGYARLIADPSRVPVAVPVVLNVEEEARREIEEALGDGTDEEARQ
ncbi:TRAP transporter small permease subunit [Roseibium litorale]|uniref:TRAP transporter small permease protein n=1 Tax=Roseibium litorale TaxID=2803841 RepID=A0ABR9CQ52_9HYPH|nr:TRAP transporter small permease [Roseibium litorale]MBD8892908.1 TRAP transporter small permease [Roseibium litorale]